MWDGFNVGNLADLVEVRVHEGARAQSPFSPRLPRARQLAGLKLNVLLPSSVHETDDKTRIGLVIYIYLFLLL